MVLGVLALLPDIDQEKLFATVEFGFDVVDADFTNALFGILDNLQKARGVLRGHEILPENERWLGTILAKNIRRDVPCYVSRAVFPAAPARRCKQRLYETGGKFYWSGIYWSGLTDLNLRRLQKPVRRIAARRRRNSRVVAGRSQASGGLLLPGLQIQKAASIPAWPTWET